jgi:hypothetical protein
MNTTAEPAAQSGLLRLGLGIQGGTVSEAYIITTGNYSAYKIVRVYLDKDEAERIVDEHNAHCLAAWDEWKIETYPIGVPDSFDGLVWEAHWDTTRNGQEGWYLAGVGWAGDHEWFTGEDPGRASVVHRPKTVRREYVSIRVRGTDKDYVNKVLQDEVSVLKAQIEGLS